jgi:uncharacterized protein (TIGR02284 family)
MMAKQNGEMIAVLNDLIETCKDGENGFRSAAEAIKDVELKSVFESYAQQRAQFANELRTAVYRLGGNPEDSGSVSGAMHRGWLNLKSAITGGDDAAVIAECERGEDEAVKAYQEAMEKSLPREIDLIVQRQYSDVKRAHDRIRDLELATQ